MGKGLILTLLVICCIWVTSCTDERILERLGNVQTISYDIRKHGKLDVVVTIPKSDPESSVKREVLSTVANSSKQATINLARKTNLYLVSGQLRNTLFGVSLAKKGIWPHIDTLLRDPSIAPQVKITIVDGKAKDILTTNYKKHPRTGRYIDRMLEKEAKARLIPKVTLYSFSRDYYDDGIDPVAPIIQDKDKDIVIEGIALFRDDRYVTKINWQDVYIYTMLRTDAGQGELSVNLGKGRDDQRGSVMFSSVNSNRNIRVERDRFGRKNVTIHIDVKGAVLEYTGRLNISSESGEKKLERQISDYIRKEGERVVKLMQRHQTDSLGIGMYVRNSMSYREWKRTNWHAEFPKVPIRVEVDVKIRNYGKFK